MEFEWDDRKAASNLAKHGVPFELAVRAFYDPYCVEIDATRESDGETRRKCFGMVDGRWPIADRRFQPAPHRLATDLGQTCQQSRGENLSWPWFVKLRQH